MTTGHVFIAKSLDGFVAREDHGLDWLMKQDTGEGDHGFAAFMDSVDGMIMGAGTFRTVLGFGEWPYTKPVVVVSRSLTDADLPEHLAGRVRISAKDPAALMAELDAAGWMRAYVDGGRLVQSFLREGLIEDMIISVIPVLIGSGISLFGPLDRDVDLELIRAEPFGAGLLQTQYRVKQG